MRNEKYYLERIYEKLGIDEETFLPFKNPKKEEERVLNAKAKLLAIVSYYNKGIPVDFKDDTSKYLPYKYYSGGYWLVCVGIWSHGCGCSAGLYFRNYKDAQLALKRFRSIYEDYWMTQ